MKEKILRRMLRREDMNDLTREELMARIARGIEIMEEDKKAWDEHKLIRSHILFSDQDKEAMWAISLYQAIELTGQEGFEED